MARKPREEPTQDEIKSLVSPATVVFFDEIRKEYLIDTGSERLYCSVERIVNGTCLPPPVVAKPTPQVDLAATPGAPADNDAFVEVPVLPTTPSMDVTETSGTKEEVKSALPFEVEFNSDAAKTQWMSELAASNAISVQSSEIADYTALDEAYREQLISNLFILANYTGALDYPMTWGQFHNSFASTSSLQLAEFGRDMSVVAQQKAQEDALVEQATPLLEPPAFWDMLFGLDEEETTVSPTLIDTVTEFGLPLEEDALKIDEELVAEALASTNELAYGYLTTAGLDVVRQETEVAEQSGHQWRPEVEGPLFDKLDASIKQMRLETRNGSPIFGIPTKPVIESFEAVYNTVKQQKNDYDLVANYEQAVQQGDLGSFLLELAISTNDVGDVILTIDDILKGEADAWTLLSLLPLVNYAATKAGRLANRALGYSDEFVPVAAKADDMLWHFWQAEDGSVVYVPFRYQGASGFGPDDFRYGSVLIEPPPNAIRLPAVPGRNTCAVICGGGLSAQWVHK